MLIQYSEQQIIMCDEELKDVFAKATVESSKYHPRL